MSVRDGLRNAPIRDPEVRRALGYFLVGAIIGFVFTGTAEGVIGFGFAGLIGGMIWIGLVRTLARMRAGEGLTQALDSGLPPGAVVKDGGVRQDVYDIGLARDEILREFEEATPEDVDKAIDDELNGGSL